MTRPSPAQICFLGLLSLCPAPGEACAPQPESARRWPPGRGGAGASQPRDPGPAPEDVSGAQALRPAARAGLSGRKAPLTLVSPRCQVCSRTMGAALSTGPRLALLSSRAGGAVPRWAPSEPARCSHSKPGPVRSVPLKKRGYDVTRNPHLNKVTVLQRRMALAEILRRRAAPRLLGLGWVLPGALPSDLIFLLCRGLIYLGLAPPPFPTPIPLLLRKG